MLIWMDVAPERAPERAPEGAPLISSYLAHAIYPLLWSVYTLPPAQ